LPRSLTDGGKAAVTNLGNESNSDIQDIAKKPLPIEMQAERNGNEFDLLSPQERQVTTEENSCDAADDIKSAGKDDVPCFSAKLNRENESLVGWRPEDDLSDENDILPRSLTDGGNAAVTNLGNESNSDIQDIAKRLNTLPIEMQAERSGNEFDLLSPQARQVTTELNEEINNDEDEDDEKINNDGGEQNNYDGDKEINDDKDEEYGDEDDDKVNDDEGKEEIKQYNEEDNGGEDEKYGEDADADAGRKLSDGESVGDASDCIDDNLVNDERLALFSWTEYSPLGADELAVEVNESGSELQTDADTVTLFVVGASSPVQRHFDAFEAGIGDCQIQENKIEMCTK
jgi:hypothetical protein